MRGRHLHLTLELFSYVLVDSAQVLALRPTNSAQNQKSSRDRLTVRWPNFPIFSRTVLPRLGKGAKRLCRSVHSCQ